MRFSEAKDDFDKGSDESGFGAQFTNESPSLNSRKKRWRFRVHT